MLFQRAFIFQMADLPYHIRHLCPSATLTDFVRQYDRSS